METDRPGGAVASDVMMRLGGSVLDRAAGGKRMGLPGRAVTRLRAVAIPRLRRIFRMVPSPEGQTRRPDPGASPVARQPFLRHLIRLTLRHIGAAVLVGFLALLGYTAAQVRSVSPESRVPLPILKAKLADRLNAMKIPACFLEGAEIIVADFELPLLVPPATAHYWPGSRQVRLSRDALNDPERLVHEIAHHFFDHVATQADTEAMDRLLRDVYWPRVYAIWQDPEPEITAGVRDSAFVIASVRGSNLPAKMHEFRADVVAYYLAPPYAVRTCRAEPVREGYGSFRDIFEPWFRRFAGAGRITPDELDVVAIGGSASFPGAFAANAKRLSGAFLLGMRRGRPNTGAYPVMPWAVPGIATVAELHGSPDVGEPPLARLFPFTRPGPRMEAGTAYVPAAVPGSLPNSCRECRIEPCLTCRRLPAPRFATPHPRIRFGGWRPGHPDSAYAVVR